MLWQRTQSNLQLPARYFGCSLSKITQINRWTAVGGWLEWRLERDFWTGLGFCCKYPRQYMVVHHMQELLEFGKTCCHFACASVGSTFALLASFRCSTHGPSTTYVGIKSSSVLHIHEYWILERERRCFGWRGVELTFGFVYRFLPHVSSSCVHIFALYACALKRARHWCASLTWPNWRRKWPGNSRPQYVYAIQPVSNVIYCATISTHIHTHTNTHDKLAKPKRAYQTFVDMACPTWIPLFFHHRAPHPRAGPSLQGWAAFSHPLFSYCLITMCLRHGTVEGDTVLYREGTELPVRGRKCTSARFLTSMDKSRIIPKWHTNFNDLTSMGQISPHPHGTP